MTIAGMIYLHRRGITLADINTGILNLKIALSKRARAIGAL